MSDAPSAFALLRRSRAIYDDPSSPLAAAATRDAWRGLFASGAEWMRLALSHLRGPADVPPSPTDVNPKAAPSFNTMGTLKYGLAVLAMVPFAAGAYLTGLWPLALLCVPAFYAVEVQFVFLFPLALDGCPRPFREAPRWTARAGGTLRAMGVVLPLAAVMLFGGFCGRGFVRCWCLGCLSVVLWYEDVRAAAPPPSPGAT